MSLSTPSLFVNSSGSRSRLVYNILMIVLVLGLLQFWRHPFFLTDDNMTAGLPTAVNASENFQNGKNIFHDHYLYGGADFSTSAERSHRLNPLPYLILPLLGDHYYWLWDIMALIYLIIAVSFNTLFLDKICALDNRKLSLGRLLFLNVSALFTVFHLTVYSSWISWAAAAAALPWISLGLVSDSFRKSIALISTGVAFLFICGDYHSFFYGCTFLALYAAILSWKKQSLRPLATWCSGCAIAALFVIVCIYPALSGFLDSDRAAGVSLNEQSRVCSVPLPVFLTSFFWGGFSGWALPGVLSYHSLQPPFTFAIAATASAWLLVPLMGKPKALLMDLSVCLFIFLLSWFMLSSLKMALLVGWSATVLTMLVRGRKGWNLTGSEPVYVLMLLAVFLLIIRLFPVPEILNRLPIYSSLRWPFRELLEFHFFLTAFLALKAGFLSSKKFWGYALLGSLILVASCLNSRAPSLSEMTLDRDLVLSGKAKAYWKENLAKIPPYSRIVPVADPELIWSTSSSKIPFSLVGAYDYPSLFHIPSHYGYMMDGGLGTETQKRLQKPRPFHWSGLLTMQDGLKLKESFPDTTLVILVSLDPVTVRFETPSASWTTSP